jgi:chaperone required for assembly of F1-ATPase
MKKFYRVAESGTAPGGFTVRLDGKNLKTPLGKSIIVGSQQLADLLAAEWHEQKDKINLSQMSFNRLVNTMIDKVQSTERSLLTQAVLKYAESDLICYFAERPAALKKRQEELWIPQIEAARQIYGADLETVSGIQYVQQSPDAIAALRRAVDSLSPVNFTALQAATGPLGSVVLALGFAEGRMTADEAFAAATVDEVYQLEQWGEDKIARDRLEALRQELETISRFKNIAAGS